MIDRRKHDDRHRTCRREDSLCANAPAQLVSRTSPTTQRQVLTRKSSSPYTSSTHDQAFCSQSFRAVRANDDTGVLMDDDHLCLPCRELLLVQ